MMQVTKHTWPAGTPLEEANFFHSVPDPDTDIIDMMDFLIEGSRSDFTYQFEAISTVDDSLHFRPSEFTFAVWNAELRTGYHLSDWLELYLTNDLVKFRFIETIPGTSSPRYTGVIYKNGIKMPDRSNEHIFITVVGAEPEYRDRYSNDPISNMSFLPFFGPGFGMMPFEPYVKEMAPETPFFRYRIEPFIKNYFAALRSYIKAPMISFENDSMVVKTGHEWYWHDGITWYELFKGFCLSMGWRWFFFNNELYLQNRSHDESTLYEIDYNEAFITHAVESDLGEIQVDNILIRDGLWNGEPIRYRVAPIIDKDFSGERAAAYSADNFFSNDTNPWEYIFVDPGAPDRYIFRMIETSHKSHILRGVDDYKYNFESIGIPEHNVLDSKIYNYRKNRTLYISPVVNSSFNAGGLDVENITGSEGLYYGSGNFRFGEHTQRPNDLMFTGNPGNMLLRYEPARVKWQTYQDYTMSQRFLDNHKKFLNLRNRVILNVELFDTVYDPNHYYRIKNYPFNNPPYHDITGRNFTVLSHAWNPATNRTKLKLVMK